MTESAGAKLMLKQQELPAGFVVLSDVENALYEERANDAQEIAIKSAEIHALFLDVQRVCARDYEES
jgi:hypothetical protein